MDAFYCVNYCVKEQLLHCNKKKILAFVERRKEEEGERDEDTVLPIKNETPNR